MVYLVVAVALMAMPSLANAGTRLGATDSGQGEHWNGVVVQAGTPPDAPSYEVPPGGGVITSWEIGGDSGYGHLLVLQRSVQDNGLQQFTVVGASKGGFPEEGPGKFSTRIPVSGGEVLGLLSRSLPAFQEFPGPPGAYACTFVGDGNVGDTYRIGPPGEGDGGCSDRNLLNLAATVEPDSDRDAFGDESQDSCQGVPGPVAGCPAKLTGKTKQNEKLILKFGQRENRVELVKLSFGVELRCARGPGYAYTVTALSRRDPVPVKPDGRFRVHLVFRDTATAINAKATLKGRLRGGKAKGTLVASELHKTQGKCASGKGKWSAAG